MLAEEAARAASVSREREALRGMLADAVRALRDPRGLSRDAAVAARRDVEMLTAALGEDEAADIAARVMTEEYDIDDDDDEDYGDGDGDGDGAVGGGGRGRRNAAGARVGGMVEVVDAEEAYEHEKAVLRAELEEIQTLLLASSSTSSDAAATDNRQTPNAVGLGGCTRRNHRLTREL